MTYHSPKPEIDPEIRKILTASQNARKLTISLIASENYPNPSAAAVLNSAVLMSNTEGYPARIAGQNGEHGLPQFYHGDEYADPIQVIAQRRAKEVFNCKFANVQPFSGAMANTAVISALTQPGDTIVTATFENGAGHFTQAGPGHITRRGLKVMNLKVDEDGRIDYEDQETLQRIKEAKPKLIIVGGSGYPRQYDFKKLRDIADECGAKLMIDMAHIAGLVAAGPEAHPSPFPYADIVTSSTHKTLGGVRHGLILWNDKNLSKLINDGVTPGLQGEPDNGKIVALAAMLHEAAKPEYREEILRIIANSQSLAQIFKEKGFKLMTGGTDNHLFVVDLKPLELDGEKTAEQLHNIGIYSNKMPIVGDVDKCTGIRFGTPTITKRGFNKAGIEELGDIVTSAISEMARNENKELSRVTARALTERVTKLAQQFPPPKFGLEFELYSDSKAESWGAKADRLRAPANADLSGKHTDHPQRR